MASNGAEDKLNTRASCSRSSNLIIRAKSAVFYTVDSHTRPFSSHEKKTLQSCARVPQVTSDSIGQLNARVGQTQKNQLHTASGTLLQRAFNRSVPAATYLANEPQRPGSAGANLASGHSNVQCQPTVLSKSTQISSADIISYRHNPGVLEPTVNSYRHGCNLDSLKLRSRILARKRALSPQPAPYPTCPCPPKAERVPDSQNNAASQPAESTNTTSMPTNQSVPWTSGKLRDNSKGFMRPTMGKVPSCSRQETTQTRDSAKPLSPQTKSASYCCRVDNGDGKTQTKFTHHPHNTVPLQDRSSHHQDVSLDQTWRLQDPHQFESPMAADMAGHSQRLGFCAAVHGAPGAPHNTSTERIRKVNSEVEYTEAVRKLTQSRSALTLHPRNGTVISFTTGTPGSNVDLVQLGKAMTNSPVISVSHSPAPAKPSVPLCLTMRDQPFSMETSSASGLDSNTTTNSSSTTASMAPLPHAGITPTQSYTQASATASSTAGITPTQSLTQAPATASSGVGITPTQASATASSGVGITPTQSFTQATSTASSGVGITPTQSPTQVSATASSTAGITPTQSPTQASATASSGVGITPTQSYSQASATASSGVGITPTQSYSQASATASSGVGTTPTQSYSRATASSGVGTTPTQSYSQASATASSGVGITPTQSYSQASATASSGVGITPTQSYSQASATASSGIGITPTQSYSQASATASSGVGITPTQSYSQASATASSGIGITPTQSYSQASATASSGVGITPTQSYSQASATASSGVGITPTQSYSQASATASSGIGITPTQSYSQASATASSGVGITPTQSYSQASATASSGIGITPTQSYSSATASSGASSIPENTEMCSESASGSSQSQRPSVTSVTTQISAIHLTEERSVLSLQVGHSPSQSPPGLGEEQQAESPQLPSPQSVTMQEDGDRGEEDYPDDELENDCSGGDDDEGSDCSSMNDASSTASIPVLPSITDEEVMSPELEVKPALIPSMFPLIPPTLYFSTANQRVEPLPPEQRKLLKWKMSTVTPNIVKHTIARSHFKVTKKSHDWLGCWGHHMKSPGFKAIREYQKLNHFPGSFQIGRKDRLWRNLSKMQAQFGKREFSFFPRSFVLPQDIKLLRKAWEDSGSRQKWIIKPPASARGIGIQVIHKWSQMPCKRPLLVQKYLHKPYLISGNKFDLRIYVYVTSYDPLRVYIFQDGLVRFASCKYSSSMKSLGNKFMHLTNYSVNKKNSDYQSNDSDKACQGHKWALKALWHYLGCKGVNTTLIWEKIKDIVMKTIIASDPYVNTLVKLHLRSPYSCHELFGFDIMLDENLKPWVLEVNISPSLHSNTALDVSIKGQMIRDVLNLAGFLLPQREEVLPSASSSASSLCGETRERSRPEISTDEKVKRAFYLSQRFADQDFFSSILDVMTPEDVRVLAETEDELSRKGEFERVFPSHCSSRYLRFFKQPRYLNILLNQWETKYGQNRREGVRVLRSLCQKGVHLGTTDAAHLWSESTYVPKSDHLRQEPSRSSVVVSHRTRPQPDQEEYCFSQEVTTSLPDISLLGSSTSSPSLSLATESTASVPPRDEEFEG
ncbi:pneumococcal serine-rich repeat protein-like isoform X3 [Salvelinus alpinus]|uniref:pneumococcal serine-rich repeat protein-like isoform X3 n=1 Tax=Salvelinus alpinus TaxID=8036 RepID=UPI0039FCC807